MLLVLRLSAADALLPKTGEWLAGQPSEAYEIEALAARLTTPTEAFLFVRDQIAYEPYAGVMKGAAGALLTRGANDFDRALLLAQLLDHQGVAAKLASGTVSKAQARELLASEVLKPGRGGTHARVGCRICRLHRRPPLFELQKRDPVDL